MVPLIVAANPGSASRKYALYKGKTCIAQLHFEYVNKVVVCHLQDKRGTCDIATDVQDLSLTASHLAKVCIAENLITNTDDIAAIGLRVVAPTGYFLEDRHFDDDTLRALKELLPRAPLHIEATLSEAQQLKAEFSGVPIVAISDSRFHANKPDYAWNYGISLDIADKYEIKRFGYHGISLESIVATLMNTQLLEEKVIVCHLGSGSSVTALYNGVSVETTMGYSPLEGVMMATRSGSIDIAAALELERTLGLKTNNDLQLLLNNDSGLLGVSGFSSDIRELLEAEAADNYRAGLALRIYIHKIQQAIGAMAATIGGVDTLIFTGTVGARSAILRARIVNNLEHLNLAIHDADNQKTYEPKALTRVSPRTRQKAVYVITTDEAYEIARRTRALL